MQQKNSIYKGDLQGYREPTIYEKERMAFYLCKTRKHSKNVFFVFHVFLLFMFLTVMASLLMGVKEAAIFESMTKGIMAAVFGIASRYFLNCKKEIECFLQKVKKGEFQVLDCMSYRIELDMESNNTAAIKIRNNDIYCEDWFQVNRDSIKQVEENPDYPFVLLRCDYYFHGARTEYELFSESSLKELLG